MSQEQYQPDGKEIATLAGGCFWCLEAVFDDLKGVERVGWAMRRYRRQPVVRQVCAGRLGTPRSYRSRLTRGRSVFIKTCWK